RELRSNGVAVIYISHRLAEIEQIADRVIVLRDGKNAGVLEAGEIRHGNIVKLMVGRDIERFYKPSKSSEGEVVAEVRDLRTDRYPVSPVSFEVHRGEILGFAGLVGAGRSEVARAIFGIDSIDGGSVELEGRPLRISSPDDAIAHGLAYVPEDRAQQGLVLPMSIRTNVTLP